MTNVTRPLAVLAGAAGLATLAASVASLALFVVAIGLVLLTAAAGTAVLLSASRVTVERFISAREVQEDAPVRLRFRALRTTRLPVQLEIEDHSGGWKAIGDGDTSVELFVGRRGTHWLAPSRVRLRDALGIFERRLLAGRRDPLLILPTPQGSASLQPGHLATGDEPEPQGLRPYASGTPLSRIHWPSLARGAGLQVRHFAPSPGGVPLVVLDTAGASSAKAVDWAVRTAAGYILTFARTGGCRVRLPGDTQETSVAGVDGDWRAMHRRLAMLGDRAPTTPPTPAAQQLHVRAAAAPAGLPPAPPLPPGVLPRSP
jgi:uncharacterized protein (DUF58 family)